MLFFEAKTLAKELLRGDNTSPLMDPILWREAIHEVARKCEPRHLITDTDTNKFREIQYLENDDGSYTRRFIRKAQNPTVDTDTIDIDEELSMAVVYSYCALVSNKNKPNFVEQAQIVINTYITNQIDYQSIA